MSIKKILVISPYISRSSETRTKQTKLLIESLVELFDYDVKIEIYHYANRRAQELEPWGRTLGTQVRFNSVEGLSIFEKTRYIWRINRFVKDNVRSLWSRRVSKGIVQRLNNGDLNRDETILLTISTPIEAHYTGLAIIQQIPELSWYTFFSDVWPSDILPSPYHQSNILKPWRLKLLSQILKRSEKVLVTNEKAKSSFQAIVDQKDCDKFFVLNHFSELIEVAKKSESNTLLHLGTLDGYRACAENIGLLEHLITNLNLTLMQVGGIHDRIKTRLSQSLNQNVVFKSHTKDVVPLVANCRYVLLIEADMDSVFIPSKVADYICSGKEVVALTKKHSPTAALLRQFAAGFLVYKNKNGNVELEKLPNSQTDADAYRSYIRNQLQHIFQ